MKYSDIVQDNSPWYGAKSLFYDRQNNLYEERVVVIKADSLDDALDKAKKEAEEYSADLGQVDYAGYSDVFKIFDTEIIEGTEVYSVMRKGTQTKEDYIKTFIDTGKETGIERDYK